MIYKGNKGKKNTTLNKRLRIKKCNARKISKASSVLPKQPISKKKAKKRTNHSNDDRLRIAVEEWRKTAPDKRLPRAKHAANYGLSVSTFNKHLRGERTFEFKPRGRPSKVDNETTKFLIQHISHNKQRPNNKELSNAEIAKKLTGRMPSMSLSAARDFVRRTLKKKLNVQLKSKKKAVKGKKKSNKQQKPTPQHSKQQFSWLSNFGRSWFRKPPPTKLDDVEGYRFVQLSKGASKQLQQLVSKHVNTEEKEQDVFTCSYNTCKRLSKGQRNQFIRLNADSVTDRNRKLRNISQDDFNAEKVVAKIQATLRANLDVQDHSIEEPVLLTTEKRPEASTIFRQGLHRDFKEGDDSMFVIIPLCDDQTVYIEKNKSIAMIPLSKDCAFVGHASLIHAGSEKPGKRLHFKLVSEGQVEDTKTYFVKDSLYPRIDGILKLF